MYIYIYFIYYNIVSSESSIIVQTTCQGRKANKSKAWLWVITSHCSSSPDWVFLGKWRTRRSRSSLRPSKWFQKVTQKHKIGKGHSVVGHLALSWCSAFFIQLPLLDVEICCDRSPSLHSQWLTGRSALMILMSPRPAQTELLLFLQLEFPRQTRVITHLLTARSREAQRKPWWHRNVSELLKGPKRKLGRKVPSIASWTEKLVDGKI